MNHFPLRLLPLLPLLLSLACQSQKPHQPPEGIIETPAGKTIGQVERLSPDLDRLLPPNAKIELLAEGFVWSEGPVWVNDGGYLLFSDVPKNTVYQYKPGQGISVYLKPSGYSGEIPRKGEPGSNGLTLDAQGRLILCQHGDRRVARLDKDRKFTTLADHFEAKRFNSPNDLCFDSKGNLYFTDPPYGLEGNIKDPKKELPFQGVYRLAPDGKLTLLTRDLTFPNGIALSPDEKTLYVAVSDKQKPQIWSYTLSADGTLSNGKVFFDATPLAAKKLKGLPDGLKVDNAGNLWATGPGGVLIIDKTGKHLGTLLTDQPTANCAFAADGSTLYITVNHWLCRIQTTTRGPVPGPR